jgi:hypothetical protein
MEELSSTAELDKQIFSDARKKAAQIKKNADAAAAETKAVWDSKLKDALAKETERFSRQFDVYRREIEARLALDRRRIQWTMIEEQLQEAAACFLNGPCKEKIRRLVEKIRAARIDECFAGKSEKPAAALPEAVHEIDGKLSLDLDDAVITASAEAEIAALLLTRRGELAGAIFGNDFENQFESGAAGV